jgi:hypothetical protein
MPTSGTNVTIAYIGESTLSHGTTPASPNFTVVRAIGRNINLKKDAIESAEVSATRLRSDVRHGFSRVEGEITVELGMTTYNDFLLWTLGGSSAGNDPTWDTPVQATQAAHTLSVTGNNTFTRLSGNWIDHGWRRGDWFTTAGFPSSVNNGTFRVKTVTATNLTIAQSTSLVNESGDGGETVTYIGSKALIYGLNGSRLKTFSLERQILDLNAAGDDLYQIFRGCTINSLNISARPEGLVQATFNILGMTGDINNSATIDTTGGSTPYTAAPTNPPFASVDAEVYTQFNTDAPVAASAIDFTIDNQRSLLPQIGKTTSEDVYEGVAKITGTLSLLHQNTTHVTNFQNETVQNMLQVRFKELGTSQFLAFTFFKVKYTSADIDPPANGAVIAPYGFEALEDTYNGTSSYKEVMQIQRSV